MDIDGIVYCSKCMRRLEAEGVCPHCGYDPDRDVPGSATLDEGTLLNDRFQLGAVIGRGGFGITYAAWDETLGMPVAIKEYFPQEYVVRDTDESDEVIPVEKYKKEYAIGLSRFVRESQVLAMLHEIPGVVKVLDCFGENGTYYIAMEYIRGVPLDVYVKQKKLSAQKIIELMRQSVEALMAAHRQGVLHRDICPSNIMVQEDGSVKLIDFGAAAQVRRQQEGKDRSIILTEKYAAIEQYESGMSQGPWTDIYGLCATMYTVLAGENPPESVRRAMMDDIIPINKQGLKLKKYQAQAIMGGLAVQPEKRIQSMEEFRAILYDLPLPEEVKRRRRFMRRVYTAAAIIALIAVIFIVNFTIGLPLGKGLIYSLRSDGFHITGSYKAEGNVEIPGARLGIPVSALDNDVFTGNSELVSVSLPGSIKNIGDMAFYGCESLEMVHISEGARTIGTYSFVNCPELHTVYAPDSLEEIADEAFGSMESDLRRITVWSSPDAYAQLYAMSMGMSYASMDDFNYEIVDNEVIITGCNDTSARIIVPSYIDGMPVTGFSEENTAGIFHDEVEHIIMPEYLRVMPGELVAGKEYLTEVEFGDHLEIIEDGAFEDLDITAMELPDTVKSIGSRAFSGTALRSVNLPYGLVSIGDKAFASTSISEIYIPGTVENMGRSVFFSCQQLTSVTIACQLDKIPGGTFENCASLVNVDMFEGISGVGELAFSRCVNLKQLILPDSITEIDEYAFQNCNALELISIPKGVKQIAGNAFEGCSTNLVVVGKGGSAANDTAADMGFAFEDTDVTVADAFVDSEGCLAVDEEAVFEYADERYLPSMLYNPVFHRTDIATGVSFGANLNARRVVLPRSYRTIGATAFACAFGVEEIEAERITVIGDGAFLGSDDLKHVQLSPGLEEIGNYAFSDCPAFTDVQLPDTVDFIGESAFMYCGGITEINIPKSLSSLPNGVFGHTGITEMAIPGNVTMCGAAFYNCGKMERVEAENGLRILKGTFYGCGNLREVVLPESVKSISQSTFTGCESLENVWIYSMDADLDYSFPSIVNMIYFNEKGKLISTEERLVEAENGLFDDCPNVTIHAYPGSTAEAYAREHGLDFEPIIELETDKSRDSLRDKLGM